MPHDPFPFDIRETIVKAIDRPNRQTTNQYYFQQLNNALMKECTQMYTGNAGVKRRVYNRPGIASGAASIADRQSDRGRKSSPLKIAKCLMKNDLKRSSASSANQNDRSALG
jgi:hypothetical protein